MIESGTKFIIISQPRTGSTLLCSLLSSCPGVRAIVEPINPRTHSHHMRPVEGSLSIMPEEPIQNHIDEVLDRLFLVEPPLELLIRKRGDLAAGFKIMIHQILGLRGEADFWSYLASHRIRVVICLRRNILMQYASDMITLVTRQPACWNGEVRTGRAVIKIENLGSELQRIMDQRKYLRRMIEESGVEHQALDYEDFKDNTEPVNDILFWLIGKRANLITRLAKQNPDSLRQRVENYKEFAREVVRLGYGVMLNN